MCEMSAKSSVFDALLAHKTVWGTGNLLAVLALSCWFSACNPRSPKARNLHPAEEDLSAGARPSGTHAFGVTRIPLAAGPPAGPGLEARRIVGLWWRMLDS